MNFRVAILTKTATDDNFVLMAPAMQAGDRFFVDLDMIDVLMWTSDRHPGKRMDKLSIWGTREQELPDGDMLPYELFSIIV